MESVKKNIIYTDNLTIGYHHQSAQKRVVVNDINVSARRGELIAILGRNGCGKSTLLRTIAGLQKPLSGNILIDNKKLKEYHLSDLSLLLSFVSTEILRISNMTVMDMVALGRSPYTGWMGRLSDTDTTIVLNAIADVGVEHLKNKNITELSDGERQRAMIARTLAQDTDIIILDEPTAFLDLPNRYEIVHLLHSLCREKNRTIIYSTHDLNIAVAESDKVWLFSEEMVCQGAPEDIVMNGKIAGAYDSSKLSFDLNSGEFRRSEQITKTAFVTSSNDNLKQWTYRLLKRVGYQKGDASNALINIHAEVFSEKNKWMINTANKNFVIEGNFSNLADCINSIL